MAHTKIAPGTVAQAETVIRWLKDEHLNELEARSGFYFNRSIIRSAAKDSEMWVLTLGRVIIGFAVFNFYGIGIFEIRPKYRGQGHGRRFAEQLIQNLFAQGSTELHVQCVPEESQYFWRALGFKNRDPHYPWGTLKLVLRGPRTNDSLKAGEDVI